MTNDGLTYNQRYYRTHRAENTERVREWFHKNPGKNSTACQEYYERTAERQRERAREYYQRVAKARKRTDVGRLITRIAKQNQRRQLAGKITVEEWIEVLAAHDSKCVYCGSTERIEMDHVEPISKGGKHRKDNIVPACKSCNASRGNRHELPPRLSGTA